MTRKKRAAEVSLRSSWEFGKAFPMLADAVLSYEEFDFSGLIKVESHSLSRNGPIVSCSNSHCHKGGYDLRPEIHSIIWRRTRKVCIYLQCEGWEATAKGSVGNTCTGSIEGTLELKMRKAKGGSARTSPKPRSQK